jgi:hypothetical protein
MNQRSRSHRYLYTRNSWFLLFCFLNRAASDTDVDRTAVDGSHPIGMVDEVTFKVIPGYAAKGRRFSRIAFKEVKFRLFRLRSVLDHNK